MTGIFKLIAIDREVLNVNKNKHCQNMPGGQHAAYILPSTQTKSLTKFFWKGMSDIYYGAYFLDSKQSDLSQLNCPVGSSLLISLMARMDILSSYTWKQNRQ